MTIDHILSLWGSLRFKSVASQLLQYSDPVPTRIPTIAFGIVAAALLWWYYALINGLVQRPQAAALDAPQSEVADLSRSIGAVWSAVSVTATDGSVLRGWLLQPERPNGKAVVLLHKLGGTRISLLPIARRLLAYDYTCLLPDSRGHGSSGGQALTHGAMEKYDLAEWVRRLRKDPGITAVYGLGRSLGASILIQSLTVPVDFHAIVAESTSPDLAHPYDYLADRFGLPLLIAGPVSWPFVEGFWWNARLRFGVRLDQASPLDAIRQSRTPVLLIHGSSDWLVPAAQTRRLREANPRYTTLWEVPGANHWNIEQVAIADYERRVIEWFAAH